MKYLKRERNILLLVSMIVYIVLWAPVIVIVIFSFSNSKFGVRWEGFTLKWYYELFHNSDVGNALKRSLIIAFSAVIASSIMGTISAYGLYKFKFFAKKFLRTSVLLPIVMPYVVTGGSLLVYFTRFFKVPLGYPSIIIAHITFSVPLAVLVILGRMERINWECEEASYDLGANRFTTFIKITIPLLMPGILSAAMLVFPWSFDDFVITFFVAGIGSTTLPIYVFSQLRYGTTPVINAIGTIFTVVTLALIILQNLISNRKADNSG